MAIQTLNAAWTVTIPVSPMNNIMTSTVTALVIKSMVTVWITVTTVLDLTNPVNVVDHHQDNAVYHPAHLEVVVPLEDQAGTVAMETS